MQKEGLLHKLDTHIVRTGTILNFKAGITHETDFTRNYQAVLSIAQELAEHFPGKAKKDGSPKGRNVAKHFNFHLDDEKDFYLLASIAQSAEKLIEFTSATYVIPVFIKEPLPQKADHFAVGWNFDLNLDASKRFHLGNLNFERDFSIQLNNQAQKFRLGTAVYAAGTFLADIDNQLGDITRAIDLSSSQLIRLCYDSYLYSLQAQYGFAEIYKQFLKE